MRPSSSGDSLTSGDTSAVDPMHGGMGSPLSDGLLSSGETSAVGCDLCMWGDPILSKQCPFGSSNTPAIAYIASGNQSKVYWEPCTECSPDIAFEDSFCASVLMWVLFDC